MVTLIGWLLLRLKLVTKRHHNPFPSKIEENTMLLYIGTFDNDRKLYIAESEHHIAIYRKTKKVHKGFEVPYLRIRTMHKMQRF